MATSTTKPDLPSSSQFSGISVPAWPRSDSGFSADADASSQRASGRDALQALLAFSALHTQVRRRRSLASGRASFDGASPHETSPEKGPPEKASPPRAFADSAQLGEFEPGELFVLDEVLQLVAERAVAITGADGLAIALADNNEIVLRAAAGRIRPDVGARIDRSSAFSGACFRTAQIVRCDDTELDPRVNLRTCRQLGTRSMVAVPLCGRRRVIGLLEAFSVERFGFNDSDVRNLSLLAELILAALKPEDEDRFAASAQAAASELEPAPGSAPDPPAKLTIAAPASTVSVSPKDESPKPSETTPQSARATSLSQPLPQPKLEMPIASTVVQKKSADPDIAPTLTTSSHRPGILVVLVSVVIASVLAGGLWWKLKNAQMESAFVQTQKAAPPGSPAGTKAQEAIPESGAARLSATTSTATPASPDALPGPESATTPATVQELSKFPRVTGIRHWSSADSSTVVLDLEDQVQYEAHRLSSPDRIYFDLRDTALPAELFGKNIEVGDSLLSRIRVAQPVPGLTRVVLETKGNSNFAVSLEPNPYRLVVQVTKIGSNPKGAVNLFPNEVEAANRLAIVVPPPTKEDLQLRARVPKMRIVVDAGHGGWDLGTVGRRGLLEKDLVLEIAQRLGKLLESRLGSEIIYTRQDDNYISLDDRAGIANQAQADLFISVHANYSDLPSARGVETYYTNFFSIPSSKDIETRENGSKNSASNGLSPIELHERIGQSRRLAASVQRSLYATLSASNPGLRDRGIKEAGFVVLTETAMPGILAEVSFVSSPKDEQRLRSDGYREQIAEALYKGIARYAASSHGVKVASATK
jgi:N-acetylmuramoyl-L-alanine amidase